MAKNMQLEHLANTKSDQDSVNYKDKIFDLVLNLNSLNQNKDAFGSLKKANDKDMEMPMLPPMAYPMSTMSAAPGRGPPGPG